MAKRTNFAIITLSMLVILVAVNYLSYKRLNTVRWDLTENKDYTVSKTTREILGGLENLVNVKVYLSKDLPAALLTFERQLRDLLAEYDNYGKGMLRIEYVHPSPENREDMQKLMMQGVRPQPVAVFKKDRSEQAQVYNSIVVSFEGKNETIPSLLDQVSRQQLGLISDFEYLLTSKVFKVQRTRREVIGWLTNNPDVKLDETFKSLRELVGREWDVRDVRMETTQRIGNDISVLVVVNPLDLGNSQLFEIDQYLMRGGKIFALVPTYKRQERDGGLEAIVAQPTNFTQLLENYGLKVNDELVVEQDRRFMAPAPVSRFSIAPYHFWIRVLPVAMNRDNPAVSRLGRLVLPWTQPLDVATSLPEGVEMIPLAKTSPVAKVRWGKRIVPDARTPSPKESKKGKQHTVIAALTGTFPSYFPKNTPYPLDAGTTAPQPGQTPDSQRKYASEATRIVVVGSTTFLEDQFVRMSRFPLDRHQNQAFFLNTIEWLALGKGLAQIRARQPIGRPIKADIADLQRTTYKVAGTFAMPCVVIVFGIFYNTVRRRRRRAAADRLLNS